MYSPSSLCLFQFNQLHSTVTGSLAYVTKIKIIDGLDYFLKATKAFGKIKSKVTE